MRKNERYVILYRRGNTAAWGKLSVGLHAKLYDRPAIQQAVAFLRDTPSAEGVALRFDDELFNIIVTLEPTTTETFEFEDAHVDPA